MDNQVKFIGAIFIGIVIFSIILTILVPFIFIWALNELFSLNIAYTVWTWFAALIIMLILGWHKVIPVYWMTPRRGPVTRI